MTYIFRFPNAPSFEHVEANGSYRSCHMLFVFYRGKRPRNREQVWYTGKTNDSRDVLPIFIFVLRSRHCGALDASKRVLSSSGDTASPVPKALTVGTQNSTLAAISAISGPIESDFQRDTWIIAICD